MKRVVAICILTAVCLILQCRKDSSNFSLSVPLNGTLVSSDGRKPLEDSGQHEFSDFRNRKMLRLKGKETIRYDSLGWDMRKGMLEFWIKLESASAIQESIIFSLTNGIHFLLKVGSYNRTIQLSYIDQDKEWNAQSPQKIFRQGTWTHTVVVWNLDAREPVSVFLNGNIAKMTPLQNKDKVTIRNQPGFFLGNSKNSEDLSVYVRDVFLHSALRTEKQILQSFNAGLKEMQTSIVWPASNLRHFAGKKIAAGGATNDEAWTVDTLFAFQNQIHLSDGPEYRLSFRIKPLSAVAKGMLRCEIWKLEQNKRFPLAVWENKAGDLVNRNKYETITLNFHADAGTTAGYAFNSFIPSKYSILLDTIVLESANGLWKNIRRAEDLQHTLGIWMKDAEASKGKAWSNANTLLYGPYTCIGQPGWYRATWRIRIADSAPEKEPLLLLDVYAHDGFLHAGRRGTRSYGKLALASSNFSDRNTWERKSIEFRYDGANLLEFRAHAKLMKPEVTLIDSVEIEWIAPK